MPQLQSEESQKTHSLAGLGAFSPYRPTSSPTPGHVTYHTASSLERGLLRRPRREEEGRGQSSTKLILLISQAANWKANILFLKACTSLASPFIITLAVCTGWP